MRTRIRSARRPRGVTLFELLVTMLIIAILAAIAVPSYRYITTYSRMSAEMNALLGDLQYARSEAVREGQAVSVCVAASTTSPRSCAADGTTAWQDGWLVFSDLSDNGVYDKTVGDAVLRVQPPITSGDTLIQGNGISVITFNHEGFAYIGQATAMFTLNDSGGDLQLMRCLFISESGMMTAALYAANSTCS